MILFPKGLTLKLVPTTQNKIYEHKIHFKLRERERAREATHEKATDWVEERKRLNKREREREKRTNQVSRSQIGTS